MENQKTKFPPPPPSVFPVLGKGARGLSFGKTQNLHSAVVRVGCDLRFQFPGPPQTGHSLSWPLSLPTPLVHHLLCILFSVRCPPWTCSSSSNTERSRVGRRAWVGMTLARKESSQSATGFSGELGGYPGPFLLPLAKQGAFSPIPYACT